MCIDPEGEGIAEASTPPRGGIAEFHLTSYDGYTFKGRVLLGATIDPLVIQDKLLEGANVELEKVRACGKAELLPYMMPDLWILREPEAFITLHRGYWYGANIFFDLFWEERTGRGPDCIEAELVLHVRGYAVAARLPIRVERTDKPPAIPDGGTEPPKPPPADGGMP